MNQAGKNLKERGIGKRFTVTITNSNAEDIDETLKLWKETERDKLKRFLRKNNLKIENGTYTLSQTNSFDKAKNIFKFIKNK